MTPTDKIPVTLEAQAWDAVIRIMAKSPVPYEFVAPLIGEIQRQCVAPVPSSDGRSHHQYSPKAAE